jgi:adenylate cyclase
VLEVAILNRHEHRQVTVAEPAFTIGSGEQNNRIIVLDSLCAEFQCRIERFPGGDRDKRVRITNLGHSMVLEDNSRIHHLARRDLVLPCNLEAGDTQFQIFEPSDTGGYDRALRRLADVGSSTEMPDSDREKQDAISPSPETLSSWFEALGQIQRSTAGHAIFFKLAARVIFNPGGLDGCIILRRHGSDWQVIAQHVPYPAEGVGFRKDLIERAFQERCPLFHDSGVLQNAGALRDLHAAIACPVFDSRQQVVAMVYGFRNNRLRNHRRGIRFLEARFVQLIADSIAAGMIRLNIEADRARQRVLLEQAFSPEVADQLQANPSILQGQSRDVTVMFTDLRGFCRVSESIGPQLTYQLLSDVLDRFTQIVHEHQGVVIDYYGDGMSAIWNAPVDQAEHAVLACRAAAAIEKAMSQINATWSVEIGHRLRVGVGIHSGKAHVGNSGSRKRLKYGPQGNTVNIASRLEQATRQLGVAVLVSGETARRITEHFVPHRICRAQLPGIENPIELFQLLEPQTYAQHAQFFSGYSEALVKLESGQTLDALQGLVALAADDSILHPALHFLIAAVQQQLSNGAPQPWLPIPISPKDSGPTIALSRVI